MNLTIFANFTKLLKKTKLLEKFELLEKRGFKLMEIRKQNRILLAGQHPFIN